MIIDDNRQPHFVIKLGNQIISRHENDLEAQFKLMSLKTDNNMYESAKIVLVDKNDKELLLG